MFYWCSCRKQIESVLILPTKVNIWQWKTNTKFSKNIKIVVLWKICVWCKSFFFIKINISQGIYTMSLKNCNQFVFKTKIQTPLTHLIFLLTINIFKCKVCFSQLWCTYCRQDRSEHWKKKSWKIQKSRFSSGFF